jgi:hypothetical protein
MRKEGNHIYLSKRNLLALLTKLDWEDSARTIAAAGEDGQVFWVSSEPDDVHYAHPSRGGHPPGRMHERTEQDIRGRG